MKKVIIYGTLTVFCIFGAIWGLCYSQQIMNKREKFVHEKSAQVICLQNRQEIAAFEQAPLKFLLTPDDYTVATQYENLKNTGLLTGILFAIGSFIIGAMMVVHAARLRG